MTKAARATALGMELVELLGSVLRDGVLSATEIQTLRDWLLKTKVTTEDLPAIPALREMVETMLADGKVTDDERRELIVFMLRILPAAARDKPKAQVNAIQEAEAAGLREELEREKKAAQEARADAKRAREKAREDQAQRSAHDRARWHDHPATQAQKSYMRALRVYFDEDISKGEASARIDDALNSAGSISNRQMMILRFWDRVHIAEEGKRAVSMWMDEWYRIDQDHAAAWELWKEFNGDCGHRDAKPEKVVLGCGSHWLLQVRKKRGLS